MMNNPQESRTNAVIVGIACGALLLAAASLVVSFSERGPAGPGGWLKGSPAEKFDALAEQQRGLDQAMWEVAHRYRELVWAGEQEDWGYARYQVEKIKLTLEQGIERRPARAENARLFFKEGLDPFLSAIGNNPRDNFQPRLRQLEAACINCHSREKAPMENLEAWLKRQ